MVPEVSALWQREGPDAGLGSLLPRVPAHLETAAPGKQLKPCMDMFMYMCVVIVHVHVHVCRCTT